VSIRIASRVPPQLRIASVGASSWPSLPRLALPAVRPDLARDATLLVGLLVGIAFAVGGFAKPVDAVVYWQAGTSSALYPQSWSECCEGHLFYPPPIAQLSMLLQPLGWQIFVVLLTVAIFASVWYCARGWSLPVLAAGIPYYLGIGPELPSIFLSYALLGNIQWILAALTVVAFRQPAAYALLAVSKMTSGIGWLWLVFRREWRSAGVAAGATIIIVGVSFIFAPTLWLEFFGFMARNASMADPPLPMFPVPFPIRFFIAVALIAWGAPRNHRWVVPIASGFALPALWGLGFLPFLVAATRLVDHRPGSTS
jgi:hypothetical protein